MLTKETKRCQEIKRSTNGKKPKLAWTLMYECHKLWARIKNKTGGGE